MYFFPMFHVKHLGKMRQPLQDHAQFTHSKGITTGYRELNIHTAGDGMFHVKHAVLSNSCRIHVNQWKPGRQYREDLWMHNPGCFNKTNKESIVGNLL
jgi:hypothetical protein